LPSPSASPAPMIMFARIPGAASGLRPMAWVDRPVRIPMPIPGPATPSSASPAPMCSMCRLPPSLSDLDGRDHAAAAARRVVGLSSPGPGPPAAACPRDLEDEEAHDRQAGRDVEVARRCAQPHDLPEEGDHPAPVGEHDEDE